MQFELSATQLLTICAIGNGFVFCFLLLEKKENRKANRFLSLLILSLCLTFTPYMLDPGVWHKFRWLVWMPFSLTYWIGPALYFYIKALTTPDVRFSKREFWHFSPVVLNYLHSLYHAFVADSNPWPWFHHISEILEAAAILSIMIYMIVSYRIVIRFKKKLMDNMSNIESIDLGWIKQFILVIGFSFIIIAVFLVITGSLIGKEELNEWDNYRALVLLLYAGMLYWLSINGFKQSQMVNLPLSLAEPKLHEEMEPSSTLIRLEEIIRSDKLYRNPELSLADLRKISGLTDRLISQTLNQEAHKNYFQFINEFRVDEIKEKLKDPSLNHLKIISLARDSGFNSKASFNRVFKTYTGLTPKQYREKVKNQPI